MIKFDFNIASLPSADDETSQRILDDAKALYLEFGLRRTSMDDVAKRVGIGRATLYRRFSDKNQLFLAVIFRDLVVDLKKIESATQSTNNHLDGLIEAFIIAVQLLHENKLFSRLLQTEPENVLPFLTVDFAGILNFTSTFVAQRIKKAQQLGHIKEMPVQPTAELIIRITQSFLLTPDGAINLGDKDQVRNFATQILRPLLEP